MDSPEDGKGSKEKVPPFVTILDAMLFVPSQKSLKSKKASEFVRLFAAKATAPSAFNLPAPISPA